MKIRHFFFAALATGLLMMAGCYYDKTENLHPTVGASQCDTTSTMTYSGYVQPILSSYCYSTCHAGGHPSSGIDLTNFSTLQNYALNGWLMGDIKHQSGYNPMPQSGGFLTACQTRQIELWVQSGAPNN